MVYTSADRVEVIFIYGANNRCCVNMAAVFNGRNPKHNLYHKTESVSNKKRNKSNFSMKPFFGQIAMGSTISLR